MGEEKETKSWSNEVTDLERVGLFQEGPYDLEVTFYRPDAQSIMGRDPDQKDDPLRLAGPWLPNPGFKIKAGTNDYTFSPFLYLWEDEKYEDPGAWRRREKSEAKEKNISDQPYQFTFGAKSMNGSGTYYGTFIKDMEAWSPAVKEGETDDRLKGVRNFVTAGPKLGTGYGYVDVTFNKYPEHMDEPMYDLTEARKQMREEFEAALKGGRWVPGGHIREFFDPNPFRDSNDPEGTIETYDWDRLIKDDIEPLAGLWKYNDHTKLSNGNKDVIKPLERFPPHDPSELYTDPPKSMFRKPDPDKVIAGEWKVQPCNRTWRWKSVLQYNINLNVNSRTFHNF